MSIFVSNTNFLYIIGILIFVTYYSEYARIVINLSKELKRIYKWLSIFVSIVAILTTIFMAIHFVFGLDSDFVTSLYLLAAVSLVLSTIVTVIFSIIEYRRISRKLTKVRLGMTTLAGITFLLNGIVLSVFFMFDESLTGALRIALIIIVYGLPVFTCLFLYWGYFIPVKVQEWAGILPPSFRYLRERQRQLAKNKQKIQVAGSDSGIG